jgi:hypothetical protein
MEEKRRSIRVSTPVLVQFPNPVTMKTERRFTQDVSDSGMRFPTAVKLEVGQQLPITLDLPFNDTTMHATGEVMWIREISRLGAPQYEIGVRFRWVDDPDRHVLARHLANVWPRRV